MRGGHQTTSNNQLWRRYRDSDLLNLTSKQLQTIQISDTEYGATSCQRRTEPTRTTTRNIRFPNQMIEQINIALEQKRVRDFSAWVIEACRRGWHQKRHHTWSKVMKMNIRVLPSEQDDIVNSLNYEGIAVIELQFYHYWQWQTACWLCHRLNGFWMISSYGDQSTARE